MAQGDVVFFYDAWERIGEGINLETDTFKIALLRASASVSAAGAGPAYSGGTTNYSSAEVSAQGTYAAGGAICSSPVFTQTGGITTFDTADPSTWTASTLNPTNARWGLLYDDTSTVKYALAYIDLGSEFDMTTGDLTITVHASGWFTES